MSRASFKTYYRAEITKNGKTIARLKGRLNTEEQLDAWLKENWGTRPLDQPSKDGLALKVWKYNGIASGGTRLIVNTDPWR